MLSSNAVVDQRCVAGEIGKMRRSGRRGMGDGIGRVCLHARARASARVPNGPESFDQPLSCSDQAAVLEANQRDFWLGKVHGCCRRLTVRERPGKECFRFWQEGPGFDRNLFSPDAIASSLEYIHNNPVSRGLCRRAVDWKWSSARYYLDVPPRQQHPRLPRSTVCRKGRSLNGDPKRHWRSQWHTSTVPPDRLERVVGRILRPRKAGRPSKLLKQP